jgi:hypothetical protein
MDLLSKEECPCYLPLQMYRNDNPTYNTFIRMPAVGKFSHILAVDQSNLFWSLPFDAPSTMLFTDKFKVFEWSDLGSEIIRELIIDIFK